MSALSIDNSGTEESEGPSNSVPKTQRASTGAHSEEGFAAGSSELASAKTQFTEAVKKAKEKLLSRLDSEVKLLEASGANPSNNYD